MKETRLIMGMPITVEVPSRDAIEKIFEYFVAIDERFSTYKETSEISAINHGELKPENWSDDMKTVFEQSEITKQETDGYFDIKRPDGKYDPSGLVKGWAVLNAARLLDEMEFADFYIDAGGDIQTRGLNPKERPWIIGIKNPFRQLEIVKTVHLSGEGIATSGSYIRGKHIYNPHAKTTKDAEPENEIVSLSVIGPNIYDADRFATAAFAMGEKGIQFIETLNGLEGYMIDKKGIATMTTGFEYYTIERL